MGQYRINPRSSSSPERCDEGKKIIAEVAPAFVGQFGKDVTPAKFKAALIKLGFQEVYEVALGADIGAIAEAHHYAEKVSTGELPFLLTSCCPSWSMLAKKQFPDLIESVSQELTPMVASARSIKQKYPNAGVVFIGPCAAKNWRHPEPMSAAMWILSLPLRNCRACLTQKR